MSNERANELLAKSTYLNFRKRERHSIEVRRLNDKAILTLFQLLGILDAKEGSLINLGLKFNKSGECRVRLGNNVIVSIPDAGTRKEFQRKLLSRWTNHSRYIWYSNDDKLKVLSDMEFDEELQPKRPMFEVDDTYDGFPETSEEPIDESTPIGIIGHSPYHSRGNNKSQAQLLIATAAAQMAQIDDDNRPSVVVGDPDTVYIHDHPSTLIGCIADKLNKDLEKCGYDYISDDCKPKDDDDLPW